MVTPTFCLLKWIKNLLSKDWDLILLPLILLFPRMWWRSVYASLSNRKRQVPHIGSCTVPLKGKLTLDSRFLKTSRNKARVEFRDVRARSRIYRDRSRIYLFIYFSRLLSGKNKGLFARLTFDTSESYGKHILALYWQIYFEFRSMIFLAQFFYQKIRYGAFLSLLSKSFLDEFYKIMAKKTCNYLTTCCCFGQ